MSAAFAHLGAVAEFINGAAFRPEDWGETGTRIIRIQNLTDPSKPYNRTTRLVSEKLRVQPGELLVSWSATLGVFEWGGPEEGLLNQHIFRVLPDEGKVDKRYLRHGLELALHDMQRHLHGATMQHVNRGEFLSTSLYLPPLPEQRRIAEVLDKAEALQAKRRAAVGELDNLEQAIFLDMFGDPRKQGSTGTTPTKPRPLGMLTRIRTGKLDANNAADDGVYPFFTCAVEPLRINTAAFDCNAVLVAGNGDLNVKYYEGKFNAYQRTYVIESVNDSILMPRFLYTYLNLYVSELRKQAIGGVIKYIKLPYLTDAIVQLPSEEWQRDFVRKIGAIEKLKSAHRASLTELDALFASLQHRAFRGDL